MAETVDTDEAAPAAQFRLGKPVIAVLLGVQLASTIMELAGLVILLPVFQYIQAEGDVGTLVATQESWRYLTGIYAFFGLPAGLKTLLASSFCFLLLRQGFTYARLRFQAWVMESLVADIRALGFRRFLYADATYQDEVEMGSLVNDLTTDLQRGAQYLFSSVSLAGYLILIAVYLVTLLLLSPPVTLVAVVVLGLAIAALRRPMRRAGEVGSEVVRANQRMSSFLVERLRHARLVRLAGTEAAETRAMKDLTDRQRRNLVRLFALLAKIEIIMEPIVIGAAFVLVYLGVTMFGLRLEEIGLFLVMLLRLLPVVKEAARTRQSAKASRAAFDTVNDRLSQALAAREARHGTIRFPGLDRGLRFEDVYFTYENAAGAPALNGVTLDIPMGQTIALVGPSGAGKSTLIDMLPRIRTPQQGRILFDETPIGEFDLESLRHGIAYAPQTAQVFNVPLAEHIRYGKPDATMSEVERAAELAGAAAFIRQQPNGYDTLAGEGGERLSGGQRQRLDLARALVGQAPILLLDEPTSNLDARSEELFREALARIRRETGITIILIGHRLSTVMAADRIVVLEDGRVQEAGPHEALMNANGWYARAFRSQQGSAQQTGTAAE